MGGRESKEQSDDYPIYNYKYDDSVEPGVAYIINHIKFDARRVVNKMFTPSERFGALQDEKDLIETFKHLGIKETKVIRDATVKEIKNLMETLRNTDFSKKAFLLIVIMTHGDRFNYLTAKDGYYLYDDDILFNLYQNQHLNDVKKILFVEACRGNLNRLIHTDSDNNQPNLNQCIPDHYFTLLSCAEGFPANRCITTGTFFIQAVCNNLKKYGHTHDIRYICDEVIKDVKKESLKLVKEIQIPEVRKNLVGKFVFGHYIKKEIPMHLTKEYQDELQHNIVMAQIQSFTEDY